MTVFVDFSEDGHYLVCTLSVALRSSGFVNGCLRAAVIAVDYAATKVARLCCPSFYVERFNEGRILVGFPAVHVLRLELSTTIEQSAILSAIACSRQ